MSKHVGFISPKLKKKTPFFTVDNNENNDNNVNDEDPSVMITTSYHHRPESVDGYNHTIMRHQDNSRRNSISSSVQSNHSPRDIFLARFFLSCLGHHPTTTKRARSRNPSSVVPIETKSPVKDRRFSETLNELSKHFGMNSNKYSEEDFVNFIKTLSPRYLLINHTNEVDDVKIKSLSPQNLLFLVRYIINDNDNESYFIYNQTSSNNTQFGKYLVSIINESDQGRVFSRKGDLEFLSGLIEITNRMIDDYRKFEEGFVSSKSLMGGGELNSGLPDHFVLEDYLVMIVSKLLFINDDNLIYSICLYYDVLYI